MDPPSPSNLPTPDARATEPDATFDDLATMTLTSDAYTHALVAIRRGDLDDLMQRVRQPVDRGNTQRLAWIFNLVGEAAGCGRADMANHLLPCVPLSHMASAHAVAWAQAMEHGHEGVAGQWLPTGVSTGALYYGEAVEVCAWRTARQLLDQGLVPPALVADQTLQKMAREVRMMPESQTLLEHLVPVATPTGRAAAAVVALRLGHESLLMACLEGSTAKDLNVWSKPLIQWAIHSDRHDWMDRVLTGLGRRFSAGEWLTQHLPAALKGEHLNFAEGALEAHPELWNRLNDHPGERATLAVLVPGLLPEDVVEWAAQTRLERLFHALCPANQTQDLRPRLEAEVTTQYKSLSHPTAQRALNGLAWWSDESTRQAWFAEDPETFAPVIAVLRAQQAQTGAPETLDSPRRPRPRS